MTTRAFASFASPSSAQKKQSADHRSSEVEDGISHGLVLQEAGRSKIRAGVLWASDVRDKDHANGWEGDSHSTKRVSPGLTLATSPQREDVEAAANRKPHGSAEDGLVERSNRNRLLQESISQGVRQAQLQQQQQQPHPQQKQAGPAHPPVPIRWERFLPQQQLRVLLVEDDDSTRHVVSALLRNCSYEVTSAASGLMAWSLLTERTCPFDIILTEVVMPGLSGIGLLSRIMAQEALKHIPVVMMSSHDSMGIVFKCLSKGAVDFLVKPVRKNELKNLWQHVWRRCQSSSGSGSDCGSGSQTREAGRHGRAAANGGDHHSNANTDSDNTSSGLNLRGGSDNGSGTQLQGSWTKRAIEVESSQNVAAKFELPTPGIVQYAEKACGSTQMERSIVGKDHGHDTAEKSAMAVAGGRLMIKEANNFCCDGEEEEDDDAVAMDAAQGCEKRMKVMEGDEEDDDGNDAGSDSTKAVNIAGGVVKGKGNNGEEQQGESADVVAMDDEVMIQMMMMAMMEKHASNSPSSQTNNKDKFIFDNSSSPPTPPVPSLQQHHHHEAPLKNPSRLTIIVDDGDREALTTSALRHSCSSAFSRYNSSVKPGHCGSSQPLAQGSGVGSNSQSSFPVSAQMQRLISSTEGSEFTTPLRHGSHVSNNGKQEQQLHQQQEDGVSTTKDGAKGEASLPSPGDADPQQKNQAMLMNHSSSAPFWAGGGSATAMAAVEKRAEAADDCCISFEQSRTHQRSQIHLHTHHHSHHHHHHVQHHFHYHHKYPQQESQTVTNLAPGESCPMSLLPIGPGNSSSNNNNDNNNDDNNNNNASATGSNNGSNGHSNAQSAAEMVPSSAGNEDGANNGDDVQGMQICPDKNRCARREAALTKFRQKRKERCFEKKVRYQSRKRLAEQRPRVRGQFVRQSAYECSGREPGQG